MHRAPPSVRDAESAPPPDGVPVRVDDRARRVVRHGPGRLVPGERVGSYRVEYEFGAGGMGRVYAAVHMGTGRPVALKVLRDPEGAGTLAGRAGRRRLYREALALSRVRHPNVPQLVEVSQDRRVGPFVALERIDGVSLSEYRRRHEPSPGRILDLLLQVARALVACHRAGLVHRDVKPANILVEPTGRAVLVDFGLAVRPRGGAHPPATDVLGERITDVGTVLGTSGYIAPEQILGGPVSFAADQFSFGVVLFEALCGKRPFEGPTAVAYARAVRAGLRRSLDRDDLPAALVRALDRMLAFDPNARFPSSVALVRVLEDVARAMHRGRVWAALQRSRAWWRRRTAAIRDAGRTPLAPTRPASGPLATTALHSIELRDL